MPSEVAVIETAVEKVMLKGDLSPLSSEERVTYYNRMCDYLGLEPVTQPFNLITLNGRLVLYATKNAAEQLRKKNGVSIDELDGKQVNDVYIVTVRGHDNTGRTDMATGAVTIGRATGDTLANLLMKAETKAKRRLTLSICGLGMLDETEVETIPNAQKVGMTTGEVNLINANAAQVEFEELLKDARKMVDDAKLDGLLSEDERLAAIKKYERLSLKGLHKWREAFAATIAERKEQGAYVDKEVSEEIGDPQEDEYAGADEAFGEPPQDELF